MLDTVAASDIRMGMAELDALVLSGERTVISAISAGELLFGVARRPERKKLATFISEVLGTFDVLPWTLDTSRTYGLVRADCASRGRSIGHLDMLIAAHAVAASARLITRDKTFANLEIKGLELVGY